MRRLESRLWYMGKRVVRILHIELVPYGTHGGKIKRWHLSCGHTVDHLRVARIGGLTTCPQCR